MPHIYTNFATSTLASGITNSATSISVATGEGSRFPSPTARRFAWLTLRSGATREIVKLIGRSGDTLTVIRGQQGTAAVAWSTGDVIEANITADDLGDGQNLAVFESFHDLAVPNGLANAPVGEYGIQLSGGTVVAGTAWDASSPGILVLTRGTTAANKAAIITHPAAFRLGGGEAFFECRLRIPTLSDATNTFQVVAGFIDSGTAEAVDGAYFSYIHSASSGQWEFKTSNNSTRTTTASGVAVVANTVYRLTVWVNANGTEARAFINGTELSGGSYPHTINIPAAAGRETGSGAALIGSVGTTSRTAELDYLYTRLDLSSSR